MRANTLLLVSLLVVVGFSNGYHIATHKTAIGSSNEQDEDPKKIQYKSGPSRRNNEDGLHTGDHRQKRNHDKGNNSNAGPDDTKISGSNKSRKPHAVGDDKSRFFTVSLGSAWRSGTNKTDTKGKVKSSAKSSRKNVRQKLYHVDKKDGTKRGKTRTPLQISSGYEDQIKQRFIPLPNKRSSELRCLWSESAYDKSR